MNKTIAVEQLLAAISEASPSGEDLRYTPLYEDLKEARRSEDALALGDWQRAVKSSDWDRVIALSVASLSERTKDLQIAAWLSEALTAAEGFQGLGIGLELLTGLLERFWDGVHPVIEEGDLEGRAAIFEFLNEKLSLYLKQVPLTNPRNTPGYSWIHWQESRAVGSEADTKNSCGEVDAEKKKLREERVAEGGLCVEAFDAAVAWSDCSFSQALLASVKHCEQAFEVLDAVVDEKFGRNAPRLAELGAAIKECLRLVKRMYPDQEVTVDSPVESRERQAVCAGSAVVSSTGSWRDLTHQSDQPDQYRAPPLAGPAAAGSEITVWGEALSVLEAGRFKDALGMLLFACNSSGSARDRNRLRLLMVKLCLKAGRRDLARPIVEELHGMIEDLRLERWESPLWIAEVLEAYYQCLQADETSDDDLGRSRELFRRICAFDVTKAIPYRF